MLFLIVVLLICAASLTVVLWVSTMFLQGYFYTEPTSQIAWQAPAAGGILAAFITLWCAILVNSSDASIQDVPYDTLFRFSPIVDLQKEAFREIWVVRKGSKEPVLYKRFAEPGIIKPLSVYKDTSGRPYTPTGVEALLVEVGGKKLRFKLVESSVQGDYREFLAEYGGWKIAERERKLEDTAQVFRWSRFLATVSLNVIHFALWFVCLWLVLRFQWSHAFGLAIVFWLVVSLAILPMILTEAAARAT